MKPALAAEEWGFWRRVSDPFGWFWSKLDTPLPKPVPFDREDVNWLRQLREDSDDGDERFLFGSLADRIEALLPPT